MVKSTGDIRNLDELGRVALPLAARRVLGMEERDELEILVDMERGQVLLQKATKTCIKCRSAENLKEIKPGYCLCGNCIKALQ